MATITSSTPESANIGTIAYKDNTIAKLEAGKKYTLNTKNKLVTDDIIIDVFDDVGGKSTFEFTIPAHISNIFPETICKAEAGMTFGEWVNSEYNTLGLIIHNHGVSAPEALNYTLFTKYAISATGSYTHGIYPNDGIGSTTTYVWSR